LYAVQKPNKIELSHSRCGDLNRSHSDTTVERHLQTVPGILAGHGSSVAANIRPTISTIRSAAAYPTGNEAGREAIRTQSLQVDVIRQRPATWHSRVEVEPA